MPTNTNRKRRATALARQLGITYQAALQRLDSPVVPEPDVRVDALAAPCPDRDCRAARGERCYSLVGSYTDTPHEGRVVRASKACPECSAEPTVPCSGDLSPWYDHNARGGVPGLVYVRRRFVDPATGEAYDKSVWEADPPAPAPTREELDLVLVQGWWWFSRGEQLLVGPFASPSEAEADVAYWD